MVSPAFWNVDELRSRLAEPLTCRPAIEQSAACRQGRLRQAVVRDDWHGLAEICTADLLVMRTFSDTDILHPQEQSGWWDHCLAAWAQIRASSSLAERLYQELEAAPRTGSPTWSASGILTDCAVLSNSATELDQASSTEEALSTRFAARAWLRALPPSEQGVRESLVSLEQGIAEGWLSTAQWLPAQQACERIVAMGHPSPPQLLRRAKEQQGHAVLESGDPTGAAAVLLEALRLAAPSEPPTLQELRDEARIENGLARAYLQAGDRHRGVAQLRRALQASSDAYEMDACPLHACEFAINLGNLGRQLLYDGFAEDGLQMCRQARELLGLSPTAGALQALAICERDIAQALEELGRPGEALESYARALHLWEILEEDEPGRWQKERAMVLCSTSLIKRDSDLPGALKEQLVALELLRSTALGPDEQHHLGLVWANLCSTFLLLKRHAEALAAFRQARTVLLASLSAYPAAAAILAPLESNFAPILALHGHDQEARDALESAKGRYETLIFQQGRLELKEELATCLLRLHNPLAELEGDG